jgi:predicted nuclease with TOPRIM domain
MNLLLNLQEPIIFFSVLGGLCVLSLLVILILLRQNNHYGQIEELLRKETTLKCASEERVKSLQDELSRLKNESAVTNQMYKGMKEQYEELEKEFEKLTQRFQETVLLTQKTQDGNVSSDDASPRRTVPPSSPTITDLIRNLQKFTKSQTEK